MAQVQRRPWGLRGSSLVLLAFAMAAAVLPPAAAATPAAACAADAAGGCEEAAVAPRAFALLQARQSDMLGLDSGQAARRTSEERRMGAAAAAPWTRHTVCVWASGRQFGFDLGYMFQPFMSTLVEGFSSYKGPGSWRVLNRSIVDMDKMASELEALALRPGDMFIWIGNDSPESVPWAALTSRGVHTVYYQTEPVGPCTPQHAMTSEMWDYSWKNIEKCKNDGKDAPPILRYLPSGYLKGFGKADHSQVWPKPTFFGSPFLRMCYSTVESSFSGGLQQEGNIWNQSAFDSFVSTHSIFIDIPKFCDPTAGVVTTRMSQLLSAGSLVVSMNSYPADEKEFDGLVTFVPVDQLNEAYNHIAGLDPPERARLAAERLALFASRFAPAVLFEKAGVYALLENLTASFP